MAKSVKNRGGQFVLSTNPRQYSLKTYQALKDPYLQAYFHLPSIRQHLKKVGFIGKKSKKSKSKQRKQQTLPVPYLIPRPADNDSIQQVYRSHNSNSAVSRRDRIKTKH